jgi:hypothetical protein
MRRSNQLILDLVSLSYRAHRRSTSDDRSENDVDVERIETPPEQRCREDRFPNDA